jgi:hypothetical protein
MCRRKASITLHLDRIPIRANNPIRIQKHREVLVRSNVGLEYSNRDLGLVRDVLELRDYLTDGHFTGIRFCRVIWSVEEDRNEIRCGGVLAENTIDGRVACLVFKRSKDLRARAWAEPD